jgi:hypothetical protein
MPAIRGDDRVGDRLKRDHLLKGGVFLLGGRSMEGYKQEQESGQGSFLDHGGVFFDDGEDMK